MSTAVPALNLSVLSGTLSREPELRTLPSGDVLLELQVTTRTSAATDSVPVSWPDPPRSATGWSAGQAVVVVGRVRRRFFRAGGATASRTEVVAERVVPASRRKAAADLLAGAAAAVAAPPPG